MSYTFYIILHIAGVITLFYALGGLSLHMLNRGTRDFSHRRKIMILHGVALVVIFVSAFGLLARTGIIWPWPIWVWGKLALWTLLGGVASLILKKSSLAKPLYLLVLILGFAAILLVELKPL
ncbi:MAG: hypothetical protein KDD35_07150 [Bdellovibrionales bacterium]|nr:hypothetical protein [Bdellovibrionales bacterium]